MRTVGKTRVTKAAEHRKRKLVRGLAVSSRPAGLRRRHSSRGSAGFTPILGLGGLAAFERPAEKWREAVVEDNQKPVTSSYPHPAIYLTAVELILLYVASAWLAFGSVQYMHLALVMVTVLFLMAIAIPILLWRVHQKYATRPEGSQPLR